MKQLLYPKLHRYHVQGDILKKVVQSIRSFAAHIYLYKNKSPIGIFRIECTNAIANYQAMQDKNYAATVVPNAEAGGNPFYKS